MTRTTVTDSITTTCLILATISATIGDATDTWQDWAIRATCVYPFTHLAWRELRRRQRS